MYKAMKQLTEKQNMIFLIVIEFLILVVFLGRGLLTERSFIDLSGSVLPVDGNGVSLDAGYYIMDIYYTTEKDTVYQTLADTVYGTMTGENIYLPMELDHVQTEIELKKPTEHFAFFQDEYQEGGTTFSRITFAETAYRDTKNCFLLLCVFFLMDIILILWKKNVIQSLDAESKLLYGGLFLTCLFASSPLFVSDMITSQDYAFHLMRIEGLADALRGGDFPVKMQYSWMHGYGYPVSVMYGDLLLYIPAILRIVGFPLQDVYRIYYLLINIATTFLSYLYVATVTKSRKAGFLGSVLYTWTSYRLVCMYIRSAVGEFTAIAFFPLVFLGLYLLLETEEKKKGCICMAIGYTLLLQTHLLSFEMAVVCSAIYCLLHWKKFMKHHLTLIATAGMTILINLGFLVPMLDYTLTQEMSMFANQISESHGLQAGGLFLPQLFGMFAGQGEISNTVIDGVRQDMLLSMGLPFLLILLLWVAESWIYGRSLREKIGEAVWREQACVFFMMVLTLLMTCYFFPWSIIEEIPFIGGALTPYQFPWRFLGIGSAWGIMVAGYVWKNLKSIAGRGIRTAVFVGIVFLSFINVTYLTNFINSNTGRAVVMSDGGLGVRPLGAPVGHEYLLAGTDMEQFYRNTTSGKDVTVESLTEDQNSYIVTCRNLSDETSWVTVPRLNYKGYAARDLATGEKFEIVNGQNNRIQVILPAGYEGSIRVFFRQPVLWIVAELLAAFMFLTCIFFLCRKQRRMASVNHARRVE